VVSKLNSETQQLRIGNKTMKMQLRELQQAPSHVALTRSEATTSPIATNAMTKSYRDVVCAVGGIPSVAKVTLPAGNSLPEPTIVPSKNPPGS
jgi:hypothetical protein